MGDQDTILDAADARHLLRRTLLGAGPDALSRYGITPGVTTRGEAADRILSVRPKKFRPASRDLETSHARWVKWLVRTKAEFQSRLVFFFHDHFATAYSVVGDSKMMGDQIKLLYTHAFGNFKELVKLINRNPAMMEFLDTVRNDKELPNENYAREMQELFTLGVNDLNGVPNYTQEDIKQIARAFTGWRHDGRNAYLETLEHDTTAAYPARGPKAIYDGAHGFPPGGADYTLAFGEGEGEVDALTDILFQHQDSDGQNTVARRLAFRLLEHFAYAGPPKAAVDQVVSESGFDVDFELLPLYRAILVNDAFYECAAPAPFDASTKKSVKWPIDYVVSTCKLLRMRMKSRYAYIDGGGYVPILDFMGVMGQTLMNPPSVFGWGLEDNWISTATLFGRFAFARDVVSARFGSKRFKPEQLLDLDLTDPVAIVDAVLEVLDVSHHFDSAGAPHQALVTYLTDGGLVTPDLHDDGYRNTKLHGLFLLVMQSPEYHVF